MPGLESGPQVLQCPEHACLEREGVQGMQEQQLADERVLAEPGDDGLPRVT
jgi:hypothetical protein